MISMIFFGLKRKLWNRKYLYKLFFLYLMIGGILHIDILLEKIAVFQRVQVSLDESVSLFSEYFSDTTYVDYVENADVRIVFEDDWKIYSDELLNEDVILDIEKSISKIPGYEYQGYMHNIYLHHSRIKDPYLELIVYTVIYFILMSKSIGSVQEIIEDKLSGMANFYLTCITPNQYVTSKILEGWIQVFIEYLCMYIFICIWSIYRYGYHFVNALYNWIQNFVILDESYLRFDILIIGIVGMLIGICMIQYLIVLIMCKSKTIEEANHMIVWIHSLPVLIYYLSMSIYDINVINYCVCIPFLQTLLLPMSLSLSGEIDAIFCIYMLLEVLFLYILMKISKNCLRKSMLNIEKVTFLFKGA